MARVVPRVQVCKSCGKQMGPWRYELKAYYSSLGHWKTIERWCWNCGLKQARQLIDLDDHNAD